MKRIVLTFLFIFFFISTNLYSQKLSQQIDEILTDSLFQVSQITIDVYDLTADEYLYRKNEKLVLRPASNLKLLTSAAALLYLGDSTKFKTYFSTNGIIKDSVLYGDLGVHGGFDPLMSSADVDSITLRIKSKGIKTITGTIWEDVSNIDSLYFGKGWMWDDNPGSYMPYLSSLNLNRNSVKIYYSPGKKVGDVALVKTNPHSSYFKISNKLITTSEDTSNIKIDRNWLENNNLISITGNISYKSNIDSAELNLVDPPSYFIAVLKKKLNESGVRILDVNRGRVNKISLDTITVYTRTLNDVLKESLKESDNLSAEMLLRKLSSEYFPGSASAHKGLRMIDSLIVLLNHNPKTYTIVDGSGLSHYNLISAELILDLLKFMYKSQPKLYGYLYNSLPIAGIDGTLERRMRFGRTYNNVRAKTGTISGVSTLSGYVSSAGNHLIAFSIFIQNYSGSSKLPRSIQDKICQILADYK